MEDKNGFSDMKDKGETFQEQKNQVIGILQITSPVILGILCLFIGFKGTLWQRLAGSIIFAVYAYVYDRSKAHMKAIAKELGIDGS